MGVGSGQVITTAQMVALGNLGNQKLHSILQAAGQPDINFSGSPSSPTANPKWLVEMNRLRLYTLLAEDNYPDYQTYISGPWPVSAFGVNAIGLTQYQQGDVTLGAFKRVAFYHEDTGSVETLSMIGKIPIVSNDMDPVFVDGTGYRSLHILLKFGGSYTLRFTGLLYFAIDVYSDPPVIPSVSVTTDLPGASFQVSNVYTISTPDTAWCYCKLVDQPIDPGEYFVDATISAPDYFHEARILGADDEGVDGSGNLTNTQNSWPSIALDFTDREEVSAIHSTKKVYRINGTLEDPVTDPPIGIYGKTKVNGIEQWSSGTKLNWEATTTGIFVAMTPPINNIGADTHDLMPWNIIGHTIGGEPIYNPIPTEEQSIPGPALPPRWRANNIYGIGEIISDSHYNQQQTTNGGISGATEPVWSTVLGAHTADNGIDWVYLETGPLVAPAVAKMYSATRYPFVMDGETQAHDIPHSHWTNWQYFRPKGWFIYRVTIDRIGSLERISKDKGSEIAVKLGVIRNGTFVEFGTYMTGTDVAVFWPIFTITELAYQAAERVEIHACVTRNLISQDLNGVHGAGGDAEFPIAAAHYNDAETLLGQLPDSP